MIRRFGRRKRKQSISTQPYTVEKMGSLNDLLLTVINDTLKQVFKEAGAKAVYNYLENNCRLTQEEIAEKPAVFSAGLERLLGSGASVIEKLILKNLSHKLEMKIEEKKSYEFSDFIKELGKRFNARACA